MPARRERWPGKKAGVRQPPKNEPAGQWGEDLAVYGDLARQRVCRGMVLLGSLRARRPLKVADWALPRCSTG